ncbi:hypothetical protein C8T65DRAFT_830523 [Cerioporus squamosus]|nr:hypothetical protein C8T65DRAFT_830523 [Cerioporus squamosus]
MSPRPFALLSLICLGYIQACSANFTFTYGAATSCDDLHVSWTGGTPPFRLTFVPSFQVKIDVNLPADAFSNNHGYFPAPVTLRPSNKTVVVMSDANGFGSGGVSPLITVGNSLHAGASCDRDDNIKNNFRFSANDALIQCNPFLFKDYENATQPVQITGVVIGGSTFVLNPPTGSKNFSWVANVAAGTELLFYMTDSAGQQGGTSSVLKVQQSENASCLDSSSPTTSAHPPSSTATSTGAQTGNVSGSSSTSQIKTGTLVAAVVVPVVVGTVLVIAALVWYRRLRRQGGVRVLGSSQRPEIDLMKGDADGPRDMRDIGSPGSAVPLLHGRSPSADGAMVFDSYFPRLPTSATTSQFTEHLPPASIYSDSTQGYQYGAMSVYGSSHGSSSQYGGAPGPSVGYASAMRPDGESRGRRKAAEAGVLTPPGYQPPAFILHTDIEDSIPPPVQEVVELPPQYSERHAAPPVASGSAPQAHASDPSSPQP